MVRDAELGNLEPFISGYFSEVTHVPTVVLQVDPDCAVTLANCAATI